MTKFSGTSPLIWQRVRTSLHQQPLIAMGILLIFIAIFSGKFSFDRFAVEASRTSWLELRAWASMLAAVLALVLVRRSGFGFPVLQKSLLVGMALMVLLHGYFILNLVFIGEGSHQSGYVVDFSLLLVVGVLIAFYFRSQVELIVFSIIAEMAAIALFAFALAGFGNPDVNGIGWAPFGGPITFYRIEFLAFCSGLYLSSVTTSAFIRGGHLIVAGIGLFSALASLSKAAPLGAICVILFIAFNLLSIKQYKKAASIGVITCVIFFAFYSVMGSHLQTRIERAAGATSPAGATSWNQLNNFSTKMLEKVQSQNVTSVEGLTEDERSQLKAIGQMFEGGSLPSYTNDLKAFLGTVNRLVILYDGSTRFQMALAAWDSFVFHKWFGIGIGNYVYKSFNSRSNGIDTYRYPHNIILEIMATAGLVGLGAFLVAILYLQVLLKQQFLRYGLPVYFIGYGVFIFVTALVSGDIYDFRFYWYIGLITLICFHAPYQGTECAQADVPSGKAGGG